MDWLLTAASTSALLAVAIWLSRNLILTRLSNAVKHTYDEKLENLKALIRSNEESLRAELKAKESQIEALRNGALSGITSRQAQLYERQIAAVDHIWTAVTALTPAKATSAFISVIKIDVVAKKVASNPKYAEVFDSIGQFDTQILLEIVPAKSRPFITPLAWALYYAYESILVHASVRLKTLQCGVDEDYIDIESLKQTVKAALPHHTSYIDTHGIKSFHHLLDELEVSLLEELRNILDGKKADKESVERAALILQEAERLNQKTGLANCSTC